jgi:hypothetical protein
MVWLSFRLFFFQLIIFQSYWSNITTDERLQKPLHGAERFWQLAARFLLRDTEPLFLIEYLAKEQSVHIVYIGVLGLTWLLPLVPLVKWTLY